MNVFQQSGVLKVTALVLHSWKESPTQSLLQLNIEQFVLEAGLFRSIWHLPTLKKSFEMVLYTFLDPPYSGLPYQE